MGQHDRYGKKLFCEVVGDTYVAKGPPTWIDYEGERGRIDGVVDGDIAVEIESRTGKQVRGAVLDLIYHPAPKKLLVLLPVHMTNPWMTLEQCADILQDHVDEGDFQVLVLRGTGDEHRPEADGKLLREALDTLRG